ncbi:hypothetical protein [Novosphingobium sp. BL-52-GroH]|uniref:DUF7064 domain-containing protein n=1 Tax=Novosphingobium sp. BL-52-GroH TaxID=3349877 RepID=UPI00384D9DAF
MQTVNKKVHLMAFDNVITTLPAFGIEHDNRHRLRGDPHSREAVVFMLQVPEHGIAGFIYPWINADGTASAATCIFGPGVGEPIQERFDAIAVSPDMDFYDWKVAGLAMKIDEPHVSADVSFKGKRIDIQYRFDAMHPVYAFGSHPDGCPQYYADDRTEQHGRVKGTIAIDGKSYDFEELGQRDHAWGNRIWGLNQHYKWFHATTPNQAVHFFEMQSFGTRHIRGFVFKDGQMAAVQSVEYQYLFDDEMHHTAIDVIVTDDAGRKTPVRGRMFAKFQFEVNPKVLLNESAITVEIEGETGTGWCEFCWNRDYLNFAKDHVTQFQPFKKLTLIK